MNLPRTVLISTLAAVLLALGSSCQPQRPMPVTPTPTVEAKPSISQLSPAPSPISFPTLTVPPSPSPRTTAELLDAYAQILFSELPRWGLGESSEQLLSDTISSYGRYPDGAECVNWEDNYYFFDRSPLDPEATSIAVLFVRPQSLPLSQVLEDFNGRLSYQDETPFSHPCYTASLGDFNAQFLLENDGNALWGVLLQLPDTELLSVEGCLRDIEGQVPSSALRTGPAWKPVNAAIEHLGIPMEDLRASFAHTEDWEGEYIGTAYYSYAFRDLDSGIIYMSWGGELCDAQHVPARLVFPETDGVVSADELPQLWNIPYWFTYYEDSGYWFHFEDIKMSLKSDLFSPSSPTDWLTISDL